MFILVDKFLFDAFGEGSGVGGCVGDVVRSHFRVNIVCFVFVSSKHSEHKHYVLSGDSLSIYTSTEILHVVSGHFTCSNVFGV